LDHALRGKPQRAVPLGSVNVLNLTRFDVQTITNGIDQGSFGQYSGLLTNPRVMQFALRYDF